MTDREIFDHELLDRCISCGFCLPACPTYALTRDEASSPRGRITLMRALETGTLDADDDRLRAESSFCLGCRACEPVCPAGVQYGQLLEQWRDHQWRGRRRPPLVHVLLRVAERTPLLRLLGAVRRPARTPPAARGPSLMLGCFERALYPGVSRAALRVLPDVAAPADQGCCGALHAHNGESARGHALAERLGERLPGVIVTTAGGCAAHLASVLGSERVRELSDHLVRTGAVPAGELTVDGRRARVAIQDSCHLRNGLGVAGQPRELVAAVAELVAVPGEAGCCGAAGTYSLLRPRDARRVLAPKLDAIEAAGVDYVVAVNPGCLRQLRTGLARRGSAVRAVHLADLLAAAAGGPPLDARGLRVPRTVRGVLAHRRRRAGTHRPGRGRRAGATDESGGRAPSTGA